MKMKEFQGQILNYRFLGTADDQHSFNCRATSVTCTVIQARFSNRRTKGTEILNTVTLRFSGRRPLLPIDFILHKKMKDRKSIQVWENDIQQHFAVFCPFTMKTNKIFSNYKISAICLVTKCYKTECIMHFYYALSSLYFPL